MAYKSDRFLVWNMNRGYPTTHHTSLAKAVMEAEKPAIYTPHCDWQHIPF